MKIVNPLSANIVQLLEHYESNGHLNMQASLMGDRSALYELENYSLKVYTARGKLDGEMECDAMLSMQNLRHVPKMYAYAPGKFVLTERVHGLNLKDYYSVHGSVPQHLLYDMLQTEYEQIQAGYHDWEVIQYEQLRWTATGEVKRVDFWLCEPIGSLQSQTVQAFLNKVERIHAGDATELETIMCYFKRHGLSEADIQCVFERFRMRHSQPFQPQKTLNG